jgi:hypothetical protein
MKNLGIVSIPASAAAHHFNALDAGRQSSEAVSDLNHAERFTPSQRLEREVPNNMRLPLRTHPEQVAAEFNYPPCFKGFTPNKAEYWSEPGMPMIQGKPPRAEYTPDGRVLYRISEIHNSRMAPRFRPGMVVGVVRITCAADIKPGAVYMYQEMDAEDEDDSVGNCMAYQHGRLVAHTSDFALFEFDNRAQLVTRPLLWHEDFFRLYRVTHYISVPSADEALGMLRAINHHLAR